MNNRSRITHIRLKKWHLLDLFQWILTKEERFHIIASPKDDKRVSEKIINMLPVVERNRIQIVDE